MCLCKNNIFSHHEFSHNEFNNLYNIKDFTSLLTLL